MSSLRALRLPASPIGFGLPGCWTLARDRAVTLDAREAGTLLVAHGAIWATLNGPHPQGPANDWGDVVLRGGARIHLSPGQQVVLESYRAAANEEAGFSWQPDAPAPASPVPSAKTLWRRLRAMVGDLRGHLRERGPVRSVWPHHPESFYMQSRDRAWHTLYHLGINQP